MHFFIDLIEYGTCDFWYFFDILTPEDQIAANLTPINDVCRVVHLDAPVNLYRVGRPFGRRRTLDFEGKIYFWVWIYLYRYWIRRYTFIIETNRLTSAAHGLWSYLTMTDSRGICQNLEIFARFGDFESEFAPVMHYLIKQKDKRSHDVMEISFENPVMTKMIKPIKNLNFRSIWGSSSSHLRFISSIEPDCTGIYRILAFNQS